MGLVELLALGAFVFALYAQYAVVSTARRFFAVPCRAGVTGSEAAREVLSLAGLRFVRVERVGGFLTDHYDPRAMALRLSPEVYAGSSLGALGVAAHEAGHAVQHMLGYGPFVLRARLAPVAGLGSQAAVPLFLLGMLIGWRGLVDLGLLLFFGAVAFTAVTLPVEFDASRRALEALKDSGLLAPGEEAGVKAVLRAAALTYVAALAVAATQFLRMLALSRRSD